MTTIAPVDAVHSFVSKNGRLSPPLELWALSFAYARKKIGPVTLVSNEQGHELLARIPYDRRIVLADHEVPPQWSGTPCLYKLLAYQRIDRPFVHLDSDVFQMREIRRSVLQSPWWIGAANIAGRDCPWCSYYKQVQHGDALADEMFVRMPHHHPHHGILGGRDWKAWNQAADWTIDMVHRAWPTLGRLQPLAGFAYEEYGISQWMRRRLGPPEEFLPSWRPCDFKLMGFTHFIASKHTDRGLEKVRRRLALFDPALFQTIALRAAPSTLLA